MQNSDAIDVRRYDAVVRALTVSPEPDLGEVSRQTGVSLRTIRKIIDGRISRPPVIVLKHLAVPKRCPKCGALCRDWPCIACTMKDRNKRPPESRSTRFVYDRRVK